MQAYLHVHGVSYSTATCLPTDIPCVFHVMEEMSGLNIPLTLYSPGTTTRDIIREKIKDESVREVGNVPEKKSVINKGSVNVILTCRLIYTMCMYAYSRG